MDLSDERAVDYKEAKSYADKQNFQYFETSAKTKINVDKAFLTLTQSVYQTKSDRGAKQDRFLVSSSILEPVVLIIQLFSISFSLSLQTCLSSEVES